MTKSIRAKIHDRLIAILSGIKQELGFNNTVVSVNRIWKDPADISSFPAIAVLSGVQHKKWASEEEGLYEVKSEFYIIGYIRGQVDTQDGQDFYDSADGFIKDIEDALLQDTTLAAAFVNNGPIQILVAGDDPILVEAASSMGIVSVAIVITYYHGSTT